VCDRELDSVRTHKVSSSLPFFTFTIGRFSPPPFFAGPYPQGALKHASNLMLNKKKRKEGFFTLPTPPLPSRRLQKTGLLFGLF